MNDGLKKILIVVVLLAAIGAVIAAKQFNSQPKAESEPVDDITIANNVNVMINNEVAAEPGLPRLLELGSVSCKACKMMKPIIDSLEVEYEGLMTVDFIDVWENQSVAGKHGISIIPTQIFFGADGKELFRHEGFFAKEAILAKWQELGVDLGEAK